MILHFSKDLRHFYKTSSTLGVHNVRAFFVLRIFFALLLLLYLGIDVGCNIIFFDILIL